jgi:hypothetical protein
MPMDSENILCHALSLRGAFPQSVVASLWGSKLLVDRMVTDLQKIHHMQERRLLRFFVARNDNRGKRLLRFFVARNDIMALGDCFASSSLAMTLWRWEIASPWSLS